MKNNTVSPKLSLVGAGPGDPELITIKAVNVLKSANVILYDALSNNELLKYAKKNAIKINVGKRKAKHSFKQEDINQLIISYAFAYGHVVRLKGGDPFVFGRGYEELQFADAFNIETEYIPGISSSIAVPGFCGIPVTHRGASNSFWVLTATTKTGDLSPELQLATKSNSTIVILMGLSKIKEIANLFQQAGKGDEAVAIIQNGTLPNQKMIVGTYSTIEEKIATSNIQSPALIISGNVVKEKLLNNEAIAIPHLMKPNSN